MTTHSPPTISGPPEPRKFGLVNWRGVWTLYNREVWRFIKIIGQTVLAPVVTSLLFLAVFSLALGRGAETVGGLPFQAFLAPGLIMMAIVQNGFANTSSGLIIMKIQGNIIDVLMAPLTSGETTFGLAAAGMTRGLLVGASGAAAMAAFVPLGIHALWAILFYAMAASLLMSLMGLIAGIIGNKFDHIAFVTNFIITPFAFLSGTFYSTERLPGIWQTVAHANPFFYMIDGIRYGFTGHADGSLALGVTYLLALNAALWAAAHAMISRGYKLKS